MPDLELHSLHVHYRLPKGGAALRERLERALKLALESGLETAFADSHLGESEELCIRQIRHAVTLPAHAPESSLAETWSASIAASITAAAQKSPRDPTDPSCESLEVVRYPNHASALADATQSICRGDLKRSWAWQQLGFWRANPSVSLEEAHIQLLQLLLREPEAIVPTLQSLARLRLSDAFFSSLSSEQWMRLCRHALFVAGGQTILLRWIAGDLPTGSLSPQPDSSRIESDTAARRVAKTSFIFGCARTLALSSNNHRSLALLSLLETDPLRASQASAVLALEHLARLIQHTAPQAEAEPPPAQSEAGTLPSIHPMSDTITRPERRPEPARAQDQPLEEIREADFESDRARGWTACGGLLFLLNVLKQLALPAQLAAALPLRDPRTLFLRLALSLLPMDPHDPAALAFCGLPPGSDPPEPAEGEEPFSPAELKTIDAAARELWAEVERRLELNESDQAAIDFVCRRDALIVADPGWLEAHFSIETVSTDLRRGALDIDPGYIPWLGVVVKFRYE